MKVKLPCDMCTQVKSTAEIFIHSKKSERPTNLVRAKISD